MIHNPRLRIGTSRCHTKREFNARSASKSHAKRCQPCLVLRDEGLGFRVRVLGFGFWVLGFGFPSFRLACRISGFEGSKLSRLECLARMPSSTLIPFFGGCRFPCKPL